VWSFANCLKSIITSLAGQLAAAIAQTLAEMEQTESHDTPNKRR
jgi:hypothetical protein